LIKGRDVNIPEAANDNVYKHIANNPGSKIASGVELKYKSTFSKILT
jgi:hypothetical protein